METNQWHERFVQQAAWTQALRRHLYEQVGMQPGWRVLDVGCGTGALQAELDTQNLRAYGIDINQEYISYAAKHTSPAGLAAADGYTLPFADDVFDACLCHFLLLWTARPIDIIREMKRVTRPGGFVLALAEPDYGGRIDYPGELQRLGELQAQALAMQGADPHLGRQLRSLLVQAGLAKVSGGVLGGEWAEPPHERDWEMEWRVLEEDVAQRLPTDELQSLRNLDQAAWQSRRRVLFVPTFYAYGRVDN